MNISFIIPVYNVPINKIERCFQSIKMLQNISYEVIVIDDGSEDIIAEYCQMYANQTPNFFYMRKENGGVSSARNMGIKYATSEFVYFVDADDEIDSNGFENVYINPKMDLVFTDICVKTRKSKDRWKAFYHDFSPIQVKDVVNRVLVDGKLNGPVGKIIKRDFLINNNICFDCNMINGEDLDFLLQMLEKNPKMNYVKESTYNYYREVVSGNTRMCKFPQKYIQNRKLLYKKMSTLLKKVDFDDLEMEKAFIMETENYIKWMFNVVLDLIYEKKINSKIKDLIELEMRNIDSKIISKLTLQYYMRYKIIFMDILLVPIAFLRRIYLKYKRNE